MDDDWGYPYFRKPPRVSMFGMLPSSSVRSYSSYPAAKSVFGCRVSEIGNVFTVFLETKLLISLDKKLNGTL